MNAHRLSTISHRLVRRYLSDAEKIVAAVADDTCTFIRAVDNLSWAEINAVDVVCDDCVYRAIDAAGIAVRSDSEVENVELGGEKITIMVDIHLTVTVDNDNSFTDHLTDQLAALTPQLNISS